MRTRVVWSLLFACAALLIVSGPAQAQVTLTIDPTSWMKTTNQAAGNTSTMGLPAKPIDHADWIWTSTVWDGGQYNGWNAQIPRWVSGDFWAYWPFTSGVRQQWFKTTLDLPACTAALLSEVRLINKYNPDPPPLPFLSINDDLYVWVNGAPAAAGGTALAASLDSPWTTRFFSSSRPDSNSVETDKWRIPNGLVLPAQFQAGSNQINVLTDDVSGWGGLAHVVFKVTQTGPCVGIDIKPGSYPNCFNLNGNGVIPVAILGSSSFDATQVNPSTLSFNGLAVRVKNNGAPQCSVQNVNADAYMDLVCQFMDDPTTWAGGTATAMLRGNLNSNYGGLPFAGSDEICIVP